MASITSVWVATAATRLPAFPTLQNHASHSRGGNPLGPSPFPRSDEITDWALVPSGLPAPAYVARTAARAC
jgi:hypothetical protein